LFVHSYTWVDDMSAIKTVESTLLAVFFWYLH